MRAAHIFLIGCFLALATPARAHIEKGSMPDALAEMEYRILLDFQPEKTDIRNQLGMVLYRLNKLDEAAREFRTVLKQAPNDFNATDALGLVFLKKKEMAKAEAQFKKALAIKPDDILVHYHLGQVYAATGRLEEAMAGFNTALKKAEEAKAAGVKIPDMGPVRQALDDLSRAAGTAR